MSHDKSKEIKSVLEILWNEEWYPYSFSFYNHIFILIILFEFVVQYFQLYTYVIKVMLSYKKHVQSGDVE